MAGNQSGSSGGQPGDPGGTVGATRLPDWMLSADEIGQTMVLLMRRKLDDTASDTASGINKKQIPLPNPFIISASTDLAVGLNEATKVTMSKEGRGTRYLLRTSSKAAFNKLCQITQLTDGTMVEVIPHPTLNVVQGVVYEPDSTDVDDDSLRKYLMPQGIKSVRRITKRINNAVRNTPLIVLTFTGTILPKFVLFGRLRVPVRAYYPAPMICFKCGSYGHPRKFCDQTSICLQCSETHDLADGEQCKNAPYCKHCKGSHSCTSRTCQKYKDEENIIRMQVDCKISTAEARKIYFEETTKSTMASKIQKRLDQAESTKDKIIAELRAEVESLKSKLNTILNDRNQTRSDLQRKTQQETPSKPVAPTENSSGSCQNSQRLSRKDRTNNVPPATRSTMMKNANNSFNEYDMRTRSKNRKHAMEIALTDSSHSHVKRPSLPPDAETHTIDWDE